MLKIQACIIICVFSRGKNRTAFDNRNENRKGQTVSQVYLNYYAVE